MSGDTGFTPVLAFDTDNPEFARGVEVGRFWEMLHLVDEAFEQMIHATNTEMVLRMTDSTGREATAEIIDETWTSVTVGEGAADRG